jgi:hypothetical protein
LALLVEVAPYSPASMELLLMVFAREVQSAARAFRRHEPIQSNLRGE